MGVAKQATGGIEAVGERTPGLPLIAAILSSLLALAFKQSGDELGVASLLGVYAAAYALWRLGSMLDHPLFTPLYGTDADRAARHVLWRRGTPIVFAPLRWAIDRLPPTRLLDAARLQAKSALGAVSDDGLYGTAKEICRGSDEWREQVKPVLDLSKAARALIIPLLALAAIDANAAARSRLFAFLPGAAGSSIIGSAANPWIALVVAVVATFCFLYFRVWHMVTLYGLLTPKHVAFFHLVLERPNEAPQPRAMLVSRGRVLDKGELPLFKKRIGRAADAVTG